MLEGHELKPIKSGCEYYSNMQVKIEYYYYWLFKYIGWVSTVEGTVSGYYTDATWYGIRNHYVVRKHSNGSIRRIPCKNIVRMWHYIPIKIDTDLGI